MQNSDAIYLLCAIVLQRYFFSRRSELKLRSASHDDTGNTSNRVKRRVAAAAQLCWTIICLISWLLDYRADTASSTLLYSYDELKYGPPWTPALMFELLDVSRWNVVSAFWRPRTCHLVDWLSRVHRLHQHSIGYLGDSFTGQKT